MQEDYCVECDGTGYDSERNKRCFWCDGTGIEPEDRQDDRQDNI
jgi:DnaJ-class molecular chaperone